MLVSVPYGMVFESRLQLVNFSTFEVYKKKREKYVVGLFFAFFYWLSCHIVKFSCAVDVNASCHDVFL